MMAPENKLTRYPRQPELSENLAAAADGGNDRNIRSRGDRGGQPTGIANVFVADENVDVLAHLALLGEDAITQARM